MLSLDRLTDEAARHPLYRGWDFTDVRQFGDSAWCRLPCLTSDDLRQAPLAGNGPEVIFYSSGTTDQPKLMALSPEDLARVADLCARFARLEGISERSRVMVLLPMALWTVGRITVDGHRLAGAEVFPVDLHGGVDSWQRYADAIRPTVISSTPSVLAAWAPHYRGGRLELVETTGEPLLARERHLIEASFGAFVHDAYGLTECVVGTECRMRDGFHYWPDATGVEVLDPVSGEPLPPGEHGELVLTSFMQARTPILRYRSSDLGSVDLTPCACGSEQPRVRLERRIAATLSLPRAVKLDVAEFGAILNGLVPGARFRFKGTPGSPAAPHVGSKFRPMLEVSAPGTDFQSCSAIRGALLAAVPELSELVFEKDLDLEIVVPESGVEWSTMRGLEPGGIGRSE